jgi:cystathionine beta-synthase
MRENGFLAEQPGIGTVGDILAAKGQSEMVTASPTSRVREVIALMKEMSISQLPVVEKGKLRGIVAEVDLLRHLVNGMKTLDSPIGDLAEGDYATVTSDTKIELVQSALADAKVAIVTDREAVKGIVTKIDLIDYLAKHSGGAGAPSRPAPPLDGNGRAARAKKAQAASTKGSKSKSSAKANGKSSKASARAR